MQETAEMRGLTMAARDVPANERQLLLRHREGDREAFAGIVNEYRAPVYSYLVRCGVAERDRDDLFQEIFIKIHGAATRYESSRPLHPWLFTIVANTVRTYHRKNKVRDLIFAEPAEQEPRALGGEPEKVAIARQTATWIEHQVGKLPLAQREVLILTCIENLPQKEVAEILELPLNTVKTHLRRARLALVQKLARHNAIGKGEVPS